MQWKKIVLWTFSVLMALVGAAAIAVFVVKLSPSVRHLILAKVERHFAESTSAQIEIRDFGLAVFPPGLRLDEIVVRGRSSQSSPPLLQIEHVNVEIKIDSVFKRQWHLRNLVIEHPVVRFVADPAGGSNLPIPRANAGAGNGIATIFDLAIQKCLIDDGEIYVNDVKRRLEAEMHDLRLNAEFDRAPDRYRGLLSYAQGRIQYAAFAPVAHRLEASFTLTPAMLTVDKLALLAGQSSITIHGTIKNFSSPAVQAAYDVQLAGDDLTRAKLKAEGMVHVAGSLSYEKRGHPFLQDTLVTGDLSSSVLQMQTQAGRIDVRNLSAPFELASGNLAIPNIRAQVLGGNLIATLTVRDVASVPHARLSAHLRDASLERLVATRQQYSLPEAYLRGKVSADTDATWGRTFADLVARVNATLKASLGQNPSEPLSGLVHVDYAVARQELEVRQSYLRTPTSSVTLNGKVSRYSQLKIAARSSNLHDLELLASNLRTASSERPIPRLDLHGSASFSGFITGPVTEPQVQGKLEARNLRAKGSSWQLLRVDVDASPSAIALSNGYLEATNRGKINFSVRTGLDEWAYTAASPINLDVTASRIPVDDVQSLTNNTYPVSGMLSGNVSARGSQLNPVGHGFISLTGGKIFSETVQSLTLTFQGNGNAVQASSLVQLPAGSAHAQMTIDPKTQEYHVRIQADNVRLEDLQGVKQRNLSLVGVLSLEATGEGTIRSPELMATVRISQLRFQEQPIPELTAAVGIRERIAKVTLNSGAAQTPIGHGTVEIQPPYVADLHLDTTRFSLRPLLALYAPAVDGKLDGEAEVHAFLRGPLQHTTRMEGRVDIPVLAASYQQFQMGVAEPVRVDYLNGVLTLHRAFLHGTGTDVQVQAAIPVDSPSRATYLVHGTVDLGVARMLQPGLKADGQLQIDLDSGRHVAGSDLIGEVRIANASVHGADVPLGLDNGNGVLRVSPDRLEVMSFEGQVGGGTVAARGEAAFRPAIRFDFGLTGKNIRLRYPEGVRTVFDTNLTLAGNQQDSTLAGNIIIERLSLTRDLDLAGFVNQLGEQISSPPRAGFAQRVRLNVELRSGPQVNAVSTTVSVHGNANLQVVGTAAEPVILGRADLNGGDLFLGGNRYVLQSGAIDFVNPLRTEPVVNAQVRTRIDQYDITLNIQGPLERLNTTYASQPPLPPVRIINLLAFGHANEAGGVNQELMGNLGAQSALVRGLGSAASSSLQRFAGLSYFSINPALGGNHQDVSAKVVIQQRVSSSLVVTYSTDVTSTQSQAVQLEYRFNSRWSVSGVRDQNGGLGATANFRTDF